VIILLKWAIAFLISLQPTVTYENQWAEVHPGTHPYQNVLVWVFGGGWEGGEPNLDTAWSETARVYHENGWTIVTPNYRLSGEAQWPAQAHDVFAAIEFVHNVQTDLRLDNPRIVVGGYSAGGHISSVVGTAWNTDLNPYGRVRPDYVINMAGPLDPLHWITTPGQARSVPGVTRLAGTSTESLAPIDYADPTDPPQFLSYSDNDDIVPHTYQALHGVALGQIVDVTYIEGRGDHLLKDVQPHVYTTMEWRHNS
jgi:acetyl esterase/lipase